MEVNFVSMLNKITFTGVVDTIVNVDTVTEDINIISHTNILKERHI